MYYLCPRGQPLRRRPRTRRKGQCPPRQRVGGAGSSHTPLWPYVDLFCHWGAKTRRNRGKEEWSKSTARNLAERRATWARIRGHLREQAKHSYDCKHECSIAYAQTKRSIATIETMGNIKWFISSLYTSDKELLMCSRLHLFISLLFCHCFIINTYMTYVELWQIKMFSILSYYNCFTCLHDKATNVSLALHIFKNKM